jgi:hypothetical protein
VTLGADNVTDFEINNIRSDIDDLADKLMTDRRRDLYRLLCPLVPVVNVKVGPADPAFLRPDHDVVDRHHRLRNVFDPESGLGLAFDNSFHRIVATTGTNQMIANQL